MRIFIRDVSRPLFASQTPLFLNPDIMHQRRQPTASDRLTIALGHALRGKARGNFAPRGAVLAVHAFQLPEVRTNNFSRAGFYLADRRILPLGFQQFHICAEAFEIDVHGQSNSAGSLKRHFINR
ncbi:MAG: hypothetical protein ABWY82_17100, partial [Tardiphaga sp.]